MWRLYIGDRRQRYVLSMTIAVNGSLKDLRKVNVLLLAAGSSVIGVKDMALDTQDHLYIATDGGIQVATPGTYVEVILPLPNDLPADKVAFDGQRLYATSGSKTFKRVLKVSGKTEKSSISPAKKLARSEVYHPSISHRNQQAAMIV